VPDTAAMDGYYGHGPRWRDQTPFQRAISVALLVGALIVAGVLLAGASGDDASRSRYPSVEGTGTVLDREAIEARRDRVSAKHGERWKLESVTVDADGVAFDEPILDFAPSFRLRDFDAAAPERIMRVLRRDGLASDATVRMELEPGDDGPRWRIQAFTDDGRTAWTADAAAEVVRRLP
jgi:hypothetical protein